MKPKDPTREELVGLLTQRNNWGRWGADDQRGVANLIDPQSRLRALSTVRTGEVLSLSRPFPKAPGPDNFFPAQHYVQVAERNGEACGMVDYYGVNYHGLTTTHIDALCHTWGGSNIWEDGKDGKSGPRMWNGRDPSVEVGTGGSRWADIDEWGNDGFLVRGVLLDVPRFRGTDYVTIEEPVTGAELAQVADSEGLEIAPGDAIVVYSGRDAWNRENRLWGTDPSGAGGIPTGKEPRPGLHTSCLEFIRDVDCSLIVWDMMDATPNEYELSWSVHAALWAFGVALLDNALLEPLAEKCRSDNRSDFFLMVAPLRVPGGTGSPVNPLVML